MRNQGYVSLWIGNVESSDTLYRFLEIDFTKDGDAIPSIFSKEFRIVHYDCDFQESDFYEQPTNLISDILNGFSYDEVIIPKYCSLYGETFLQKANAVILLYDFQYTGVVREFNDEQNTFKYLDSVIYK